MIDHRRTGRGSYMAAAAAALTLWFVPPALGADVNLGTGDSIALDQMRVLAAFDSGDRTTRIAPSDPSVGYTFVADTGATGIFIALRGHLADALSPPVDPNLYPLAGQYFEQGVGGVQAVNLTDDLDVIVSAQGGFLSGGTPPGNVGAFYVDDVHALADPNLDLGSFAGIIGMPGMVGYKVEVDLGNMTPFDYIGVGFTQDSIATASTVAGTTYQIGLGKIAFDPTTGQANPSDPLPAHESLPTIQVGTSSATGNSTGTFLFDSGAQLSMISGDTARNDLGLNLDPNDPDTDVVDFLPVGGVGGVIEIPLVQISSMSLPTSGGDNLVFDGPMAVGVLDVPGLPVDGILGFNPFTTGYLDVLLANIDDVLGGETGEDIDGLFTHMALDFQTDDWFLELTTNPDYDPAALSQNIDELSDLDIQGLFGIPAYANFAWPAFEIVPEPGTVACMALLGLGLLCPRRKR